MRRGEQSNIIFFNEDCKRYDVLDSVLSEAENKYSDFLSSSYNNQKNFNFTYLKKNNSFMFDDRVFAGAYVIDVPDEDFLVMYSTSLQKSELEQRARVFTNMYNDTFQSMGSSVQTKYNPFTKSFLKDDAVFERSDLETLVHEKYVS